ncbi:MAG: hypothetical protein MJ246_03290 [Clostridia bacterium]|nr:hypothetical protein [Clostridia bacterium]
MKENIKSNKKKKRNITFDNIIRKRSSMLGLLFVLIILALLGRIAWIQIVHGADYKEKTNMQQVTKNNNIIQAIRGSIRDRNGYELVFSKRVYNVIFDPSIMKSLKPETLAAMKDAMYSNAGITANEIDTALAKTDKKYAIVKKAITKEQKEAISFELEDYSIPGLTYEEDFIREYLGNNFACHLIGFATNGTGR